MQRLAPNLVANARFGDDERYVLQEFLGAGRYGEVWRALDTHRGSVVALKILFGSDPAAAWHEATRLTELKSTHILEVNNAALALDVPFIATELAAHGTVARVATPLGVAPRDAISWIRQTLWGLKLCHRRRLLHRDVKPENIFLTSSGTAQLGDFGVAAFMDADGQAPPHGDPDIRAPEVLGGNPCTVQSDLYSVGVSLYALLGGGLPLSYEQDFNLDGDAFLAAVLRGVPDVRDRAPHVSIALGKVVRRAMAKHPADRYPSAAAFDDALGALPAAKRRIARVSPHADHIDCWVATGANGHQVSVCVIARGDTEVDVHVAHTETGRRIKAACARVRPGASLQKHLRKVFQLLRT